jgi:hypothetical protein
MKWDTTKKLQTEFIKKDKEVSYDYLREAFDALADQYEVKIDEATANGNEKLAEELGIELAEAENAEQNIIDILKGIVN